MRDHMMRILLFLDACIERIEVAALAIGVLGITLVSVLNVFLRNVLGGGLAWAVEVNQAFMVLITFLGIGYAARIGRHIRMTAIYDQLPRHARKVLMTFIALATAALLLYLAWHAAFYVQHVHRSDIITPALRLPLFWIYLVVPTGLLLCAIQYLLAAARNLLEHDVYVSFREKDGYEDAADAEATARRI